MTSQERFVAYWTGFNNNGVSLEKTPKAVDFVHVFLFNIDRKKAINHQYILTGGMTWGQIKKGVRFLQKRGTKVLASLMSTSDYIFNQIKRPKEFAQRAVDKAIGEWGFDGIDIDPEMTDNVAPNKAFIRVIEELRNALGNDKLLTYVSYELGLDGKLLKKTHRLLDYVCLMGYFWDTAEMVSQFNAYAPKYVPREKLLFGVSPHSDNQTPLDEVKELCTWEPAKGHKGGMMLYATPFDKTNMSNQPNWAYSKAITRGLLERQPVRLLTGS